VKVAIDVTNLDHGLTSGTPIYMYNLLCALIDTFPSTELVLLYGHRSRTAGDDILAELARRGGGSVSVVRYPFFRRGVPKLGWWYGLHPSVGRLLGEVDIFHSGDFFWPRPDGTPMVISILDLSTILHPEHHWWINRYRHARKLKWARRFANRIITISEATKRDLVRELGMDEESIDVTPLARGFTSKDDYGVDRIADVRRRYGLGAAPYIFTVGTLEPRKNQVRLIKAFELIADSFPDLRLVLAGGRGWKMSQIDEALVHSRCTDRIHWLDFVAADDLQALYAGAHLFAYPSLYEGFGLPLLEAMAAGVPVLTSSVSSLPEVVGSAGVLVNPSSTDDIRAGLQRLLEDADLRRELSRRGKEREAQFTWRRTAEQTFDSYHRVLNACDRPCG
jgi:glycosyltransferase involved in cell wall biosynthesis